MAVDCKLKLELDGVDESFGARFSKVVVTEFKANEDRIHAYADEVHHQKLHHSPARAFIEYGRQELDGCDDIETAKDCFLHGKADELNALHSIELPNPSALGMQVRRVGSIDEDEDRNMKCDAVDDYGCLYVGISHWLIYVRIVH